MNNKYTELMLILLRLEGKIDALAATLGKEKGEELSCVIEPSYALKEGNLMDAGIVQKWNIKLEGR